MAPLGILRAIETQAADKAAEIERGAEDRIAEILAEAEARADRETDRFIAERTEREQRASARKLHSAEIARNRAIADVRSQVFEKLFKAAHAELATLRDTATYPSLLEALIVDAAVGLAAPCTVHVAPADGEFAVAAVGRLGLEAEVEADLSTIGGAVVSSCDGRTANDNTFEARLARIQVECVRDIWEVLES